MSFCWRYNNFVITRTIPQCITTYYSSDIISGYTINITATTLAQQGTCYFRVTMDGVTSDVAILTISPQKKVTVGTQNESINARTAGQITFPVTTENIINPSYTATVTNLPTGMKVSGQVTISNNYGTLKLEGNTSTVAGIYSTLRLTINGCTVCCIYTRSIRC